MTSHTSHSLGGIQLLRGIAALMVLIEHTTKLMAERLQINEVPQIFYAGTFGVDIFFCISGFIMYYSTSESFSRPLEWRRFMVRRVARIYPPYWVVTLLTLACVYCFGALTLAKPLTVSYFIKSWFLLPQETGPMVFPGWTLVHEMRFYITYALCLLLPRSKAFAALSVWLLLSLCVLAISIVSPTVLLTSSGRVANFLLHPSSIEFVAGVFAAWLVLNTQHKPKLTLATCVVATITLVAVLFFAHQIKPDIRYYNLAVYAMPAFLLVLAVALLDRDFCISWLRSVVLFGDASYSTYLVHTVLLGLSGMLLVECITASNSALTVVGVGVAIIAAIQVLALLAHVLVEKPLHRWVCRKLPRDWQ